MSAPDRIKAILSRAEFFRELSPDACLHLASMSRSRELDKGKILFMEGGQGDSMFLLVEGAIRLHKATAEGNEVGIRTVRPGETFGEVVLFEENRYPVTATALSASSVLAFGRVDMRSLLGRTDFRDEFIAMLMRKQRYLAERVRYLTVYDVETRFLLFVREQYGTRAPAHVNISKKDVAAAIGATPETFSRLIGRLRAEERIRWDGKALSVRPEEWSLLDDVTA